MDILLTVPVAGNHRAPKSRPPPPPPPPRRRSSSAAAAARPGTMALSSVRRVQRRRAVIAASSTTALLFWWLLASFSSGGVQAAHSRRRRVVRTTTKSSERYDRSVTQFDPTGRLLQVEHGWTAAARGSTTVAAAIVGDAIYVVTTTSATTSRSAIPKLHPLDHRSCSRQLWLATAGLAGDARWLVGRLRAQSLRAVSHRGVPATVTQIAKASADVQHALTITAGLRPLGVTAIVLGFDQDDVDDGDNDEESGPKLFRCSAGGVREDCLFCCAGAQHEAVQTAVANCYSELIGGATASSARQRRRQRHEIVERLVRAVWEGLGQTKTAAAASTTSAKQQRGSNIREDKKEEDDDDDDDNDNRTELEVWMFSRRGNPVCFTGVRDGASIAKVKAFLSRDDADDSAEQEAVSPPPPS